MTLISRNPAATAARLSADLATAKAAAIAAVNLRIGNQRAAYITVAPGQEMIYQRKEAEAREYLSFLAEPATLTEFPLIAAEVGITAPTAAQVAQVWLNMAAAWVAVAAALETARMTQIGQIESAQSVEEIPQF